MDWKKVKSPPIQNCIEEDLFSYNLIPHPFLIEQAMFLSIRYQILGTHFHIYTSHRIRNRAIYLVEDTDTPAHMQTTATLMASCALDVADYCSTAPSASCKKLKSKLPNRSLRVRLGVVWTLGSVPDVPWRKHASAFAGLTANSRIYARVWSGDPAGYYYHIPSASFY